MLPKSSAAEIDLEVLNINYFMNHSGSALQGNALTMGAFLHYGFLHRYSRFGADFFATLLSTLTPLFWCAPEAIAHIETLVFKFVNFKFLV